MQYKLCMPVLKVCYDLLQLMPLWECARDHHRVVCCSYFTWTRWFGWLIVMLAQMASWKHCIPCFLWVRLWGPSHQSLSSFHLLPTLHICGRSQKREYFTIYITSLIYFLKSNTINMCSCRNAGVLISHSNC